MEERLARKRELPGKIRQITREGRRILTGRVRNSVKDAYIIRGIFVVY